MVPLGTLLLLIAVLITDVSPTVGKLKILGTVFTGALSACVFFFRDSLRSRKIVSH